MAMELSERSADLASQALDNLVNQFARPLDFLRELVQNAIDAGTPHVDVWFRFQAKAARTQGVLEIHIDDFGDGMDERIIDGELTRMFASSKEDDLTKIGKFGIGFTSIFAIRPEAVLLRTGRHGDFWELVFHPDRSFDKVAIDQAVYGTKITLFKTMEADEVESFVARCRWTLSYWLEHSDVPVRFAGADLAWRDGEETPAPTPPSADPFAAFAAPSAPVGDHGHLAFEQLNRPLALDADLSVPVNAPDLTGFVGYGKAPLHAFYNGGLTLIRSSSGDALGAWRRELGHLSFKLKGRHLEHTLTRDNVLHDEAWLDAMNAVSNAAWRLRPLLLDRIAGATHPGGNPDPWLWHLAAECRGARAHRDIDDFAKTLVLPLASGEPVAFSEVLAQDRRLGHVLVSGEHPALDESLIADGLIVLSDRPAVRAVLRATWDPFWLGQAVLRSLEPLGVRRLPFVRRDQPIVCTDDVFALPELIEDDQLPPDERALVEATRSLLGTTGSNLGVRLGDFGGLGVEDELALEGPEEGGVFSREPREGWFVFSSRSQCLLVNRHHDVVRAQCAVAHTRPALAAYGLLCALLTSEDDRDLLPALLQATSETLP
ncbi:MAG: ATP-binding protein [Deltaproteobacteria bacterium]|nr:ATP-binding protein [Deltaproteobacteria bacterium]